MAEYKSITEMAEEIRDAALDNIEYSGITLRELCDKLKSNEYAPVVRCSECKFRNTSWYDKRDMLESFCRWDRDESPNDDDYCSYGVRLEDKPCG